MTERFGLRRFGVDKARSSTREGVAHLDSLTVRCGDGLGEARLALNGEVVMSLALPQRSREIRHKKLALHFQAAGLLCV